MPPGPSPRLQDEALASTGVDGDPMATLSEVIAAWQAEGYTGNWYASGDQLLRCNESCLDADPSEVTVERRMRFEGQSDPDDEVILFALSAPDGRKGLYSTAYGPSMPAEDAAVIAKLTRR
jgi:hypothetical protein